uniref:Capsid protein n=1 Tax=Phytophthora palustris toti-like virus 12-3 TaxID=2976308 RepID=A0A9E8YYI8_9VIRU|nr:capsid protein [Phytophthora palustris toti-like virus 12-3]
MRQDGQINLCCQRLILVMCISVSTIVAAMDNRVQKATPVEGVVDERLEKSSQVMSEGSSGILRFVMMMGLVWETVKQCFEGPVGVRVLSRVQLSWLQRWRESVKSGAAVPVELSNAVAWDDSRGSTFRQGADSATALVPAGRAKQDPFRISWVASRWSNTKLGGFGQKVADAFEMESQGFDAAFHRFVRADKDGLNTFLYARVVKNVSPFVAWTREALCHAYLPRAIQRNLFQPAAGAGLTLLPPDKKKEDTMGSDRLVMGDATLPGGPNNRVIRVLPRDGIVEAYDQHDLSGPTFVSRATNAEQLAFDLSVMWVGCLDEVALYGAGATFVAPLMEMKEVKSAFGRYGLPFGNDGKINIGRVVHWIRARTSVVPSSSHCLYTQGDVERVYRICAVHRFRWQDGAGNWRSLSDMDDGSKDLNVVEADWLLRCADALGIVASVEGYGVAPDWRTMEGHVWWLGLFLGQVSDLVLQMTCGHWANLRFPEFAPVRRVVDMLHSYLIQVGYTDAGETPLGVWWSVPDASFSVEAGGKASTYEWKHEQSLSATALSGKRGETLPEPEESDLGFGGVWGSPGKVLDTVWASGKTHDVWLLMARSNWASLLGDRFGWACTGKSASWTCDRRIFPTNCSAVPKEMDCDDLARFFTRAMIKGGLSLTLRPSVGRPATTIPVVKSNSGTHSRFELETSFELLAFLGERVEISGDARLLQFVEPFHVLGGDAVAKPEAGSLSAALFGLN